MSFPSVFFCKISDANRSPPALHDFVLPGFISEALPALFDSHHDVHLDTLPPSDSKDAGALAGRDFVAR